MWLDKFGFFFFFAAGVNLKSVCCCIISFYTQKLLFRKYKAVGNIEGKSTLNLKLWGVKALSSNTAYLQGLQLASSKASRWNRMTQVIFPRTVTLLVQAAACFQENQQCYHECTA